MAKLTGKKGRVTSSTRTSSAVRRPNSSAPKKQHSYKPKQSVARKPVKTTRTTGPSRVSYKSVNGRSTKNISTFALRMKILRALMMKHQVAIIIVACVIVVGLGVGAYFMFFAGDKQEVATVTESAEVEKPVLTEASDPLVNKEYTQEELDGLSGKNLDMDDAEYAEILDSERVFIGVTIGEPTEYEAKLVQKLEEAINEEYHNGTVGDCIPYNSNGDINQQIQDVRSLMNIGAKAIIICSTSVDEYIVITDMAKEKGIKVVAVNAPIDSGYDINIVADDNDFGIANATFVSNNIGKGNVVQFIDASEGSGNKARLDVFNAKVLEFSNVNLNATVNMDEGISASKAYDSIKEQGTIEAIYADNGYALGILDEVIKREELPKVFIGDATAGFIKRWHELVTTGVTIQKTREDDDDDDAVKYDAVVLSPSMKVFVRPAPLGVAATAVKFAIRLAEGKEIKPEALSDNKTYYYTGSIAIIESVLPYYYEMVKDKPDDFVVNDWPSDYEVDQYFEGTDASYYDTTELKLSNEKVEVQPEVVADTDEDTDEAEEADENADEKTEDETQEATE